MLEKVNGFSKSHFAKKKFPEYITNFKRNWCTDLIKFWASCSIITGRAANITVLINTTTTPPPPPTAMLFLCNVFYYRKAEIKSLIIDGLLDFRWERRPISWRRRQFGSSSLALVGSLSCFFLLRQLLYIHVCTSKARIKADKSQTVVLCIRSNDKLNQLPRGPVRVCKKNIINVTYKEPISK